jgi:hypothetical protein
MTNDATAFKCRALPSHAPGLLHDVRCNRAASVDVEEACYAAGDKAIDGSIKQTMNSAVASALKPAYPLDVMVMCLQRYVACPVSPHYLEQMVAEHGNAIDL